MIFLSIRWFMSVIPKGAHPPTPGSSITDQGANLARSLLKKRFSGPNSPKTSLFKALAEQKRKKGVGGDMGEAPTPESCLAFSMALQQSWHRPEGHTVAPPEAPKPASLAMPEAARRAGCDRILVGPSEAGTIARLQIGSGAMAGTEIQLRASEKGLEASVLQASEVARSSVSGAIMEMAARMRRRGHTVHLAGNSQERQKDRKNTKEAPDE